MWVEQERSMLYVSGVGSGGRTSYLITMICGALVMEYIRPSILKRAWMSLSSGS